MDDILRIAKQPGYSLDSTSLLTDEDIALVAPHKGRRATKHAPWFKYTSELFCRYPGPSSAFVWANENEFNRAVDNWRKANLVIHPELHVFAHIPNENSHKKSGIVGGFPDWFLPVRRGAYSGLAIELKVKDGEPSARQVDVLHRLEAYGNYCVVIWDDLGAVIEEVEGYLGGKV